VPFLDGMQGGLLGVGIAAVVYVICGYLFKSDEGVDEVFNAMVTADDKIVREGLL